MTPVLYGLNWPTTANERSSGDFLDIRSRDSYMSKKCEISKIVKNSRATGRITGTGWYCKRKNILWEVPKLKKKLIKIPEVMQFYKEVKTSNA